MSHKEIKAGDLVVTPARRAAVVTSTRELQGLNGRQHTEATVRWTDGSVATFRERHLKPLELDGLVPPLLETTKIATPWHGAVEKSSLENVESTPPAMDEEAPTLGGAVA